MLPLPPPPPRITPPLVVDAEQAAARPLPDEVRHHCPAVSCSVVSFTYTYAHRAWPAALSSLG